jgi:hypothetical protein
MVSKISGSYVVRGSIILLSAKLGVVELLRDRDGRVDGTAGGAGRWLALGWLGRLDVWPDNGGDGHLVDGLRGVEVNTSTSDTGDRFLALEDRLGRPALGFGCPLTSS